jgi:hypothetical protein
MINYAITKIAAIIFRSTGNRVPDFRGSSGKNDEYWRGRQILSLLSGPGFTTSNPPVYHRWKISLFQAPFSLSKSRIIPENPVNPPFSVPVENNPEYRPFCQNMAKMHLACPPPKALEPRLFSPLSLPHPDPRNPARTRI